MTDYQDYEFSEEKIINREIIDHAPPMTDRSFARRIALLALYEIDSANHAIDDVMANHLIFDGQAQQISAYGEELIYTLHNATQEDITLAVERIRAYVFSLVRNIYAYRQPLDAVLQEYAPEWPFHQVATIDRNILRIALYELAVDRYTAVPLSVAIDEAVELAKVFGAEGTPRFVNGVLGAIANDIKAVQNRLTDAKLLEVISQITTPPADKK